jgi:HAD superfamily hydrolase (TIGR01549 family)
MPCVAVASSLSLVHRNPKLHSRLMAIEAVVFDLDETLVDTSSLRAARDRQDWNGVKQDFHRVSAFQIHGTEAHTVPAELRRRGVPVGLVTHAPRWYVDELCDRFGIRVDAVITGSDGYPVKPDPTSLKAIAGELGVPASDCAYVGDLDTDTAAAIGAGMLSVGVCWSQRAPAEWRRWWPDVAIARPAHLLELEAIDTRRPLAEVILAGNDPRWHWGTLMRVESGVGALGRYFTPEDVDRHPSHDLSRLLLKAKEDPAAASRVAEIFAALADRPTWADARPDLVLSVPPRPGQDYDRFAVVRQALAEALGANESGDVLEMRYAVDNYKRMNHDERREANRDRFAAAALDDEHVVLIDDVLTSGGQVEACRDALLAAGAGRVDVIALAATQNRLPEACPYCGAHLRTYIRHSDGRPFIGCPSYFTQLRCPYTRDAN